MFAEFLVEDVHHVSEGVGGGRGVSLARQRVRQVVQENIGEFLKRIIGIVTHVRVLLWNITYRRMAGSRVAIPNG